MNTQKHTEEVRQLKNIPQFAGMTEDEIHDWMQRELLREHAQWEQEFQERLDAQRKDDLERIKSKKTLDLNPKPVLVEDCIKLDVGGKCLYIDRNQMSRRISTRRNDWLNA